MKQPFIFSRNRYKEYEEIFNLRHLVCFRIVAKHQLELAKKEVDVEKLRDKVKLQSEELQKQSAAYELQMKLQKEELELEFKKEKINLFESFEQEKIKLLEKHRNDIYDYENVFMKVRKCPAFC